MPIDAPAHPRSRHQLRCDLIGHSERDVLRLPSSLLAQLARVLKTSTDEILGLKDVKPGIVVRDRRFLKRLPAIDAVAERQKDALLTTIDGLLRGTYRQSLRLGSLSSRVCGGSPTGTGWRWCVNLFESFRFLARYHGSPEATLQG